jgi:hypothetical protein
VYGGSGNFGDQQPVTWVVEQSNQENVYGTIPSMPQQMQYSNQQSNPYQNISYANNPYPTQQPLYSQMPLAIPPPPPPPPARLPLPPLPKEPRKGAGEGTKHPGPSKSKKGEPPSAKPHGNMTNQSAHPQQSKGKKDITQTVKNAQTNLSTKKSGGEATKSNNPVDANLSAINALSVLETQWAAPPSKPLTKNQRRQRRRNRIKQKDQTKPPGSGTAHDVVDLIGEWVNLDHSEPSQSKGSNLRLKTAEEMKQQSHQNASNNVVDLTDDTNQFPPLSGNRDVVAAAADYSGLPLEEMSKSQLKSYAAVLSRAIDETHSSFEDEMDISDEENEGAGSHKQTANSMSKKLQDVSSSEVSYADSNESIHFNATVNATPTSEKASRLHDEREKCRLRLEELRAKAKLANAKLKLAKKKRALENNTPPPIQGVAHNRRSSAENANDLKFDEGSALKKSRLLYKPSIPGVTALRQSLVVEVHLLADGKDQTNLRFVDSVYEDTSDDETQSLCESVTPPVQEVKPAVPDPDSSRKASELKQKLQLAKMRLELKKKELELKRKKSTAAPQIEDNLGESALESALETTEHSQPVPQQSLDSDKAAGILDEKPRADSNLAKDEDVNATAAYSEDVNIDSGALSLEQKAAQVEELKRRQKELKQSNEVSFIKNLIQRQREILRVKGLELTDSSTQLQTCVKEIKSKQQDLTASEKRIEEMNHRKRIMEGMVLRATEKLMTARRNLRERQVQEASKTT